MSTNTSTTTAKETGGTSTIPESKKRNASSSLPRDSKKSRTSSKRIANARSSQPQPLQPGRRVRQILAPKARGDIRAFKDAIQLFSVCRDAYEGLTEMYEQTGIVHGSVAAQHIIINKDGTGTLIDWDIPGMESLP